MILGVEPPGEPGGALCRLLLGLDLFPHALGHAGAACLVVAEHMRVPPDHLFSDRLDDTAEIERALLAGHLCVEHHLQQEVAELVAQIDQVAARNRIGDLVGLFERVWRDGREILL